MPGSKGPHHSEKMKRCVEDVMAKGHDESSAYAICTVSMQKAGEPIFEASESVPDVHLHLCGALGKSRVEMLDGREHLVVPVVALMEGVIHPVNAATPEFVPAETIRRAASSWNGRPVVIGHPVRNGRQCSANDPAILEAHSIGTVFNARVEGIRLLCDAWIDKAKAMRLHPELYSRLSQDKVVEVSVGAYVTAEQRGGNFNGKPYKALWRETTGDHLAFLPGGRGACSVEMGCGACRAAEAYEVVEDGFRAAGAVGIDELARVLETLSQYDPQVLKAAIGRRNNATDAQMIQDMHDSTMALGAKCDSMNIKMIAAGDKEKDKPCGCSDLRVGSRRIPKRYTEKLIRTARAAGFVTDLSAEEYHRLNYNDNTPRLRKGALNMSITDLGTGFCLVEVKESVQR